MGIIKIARSYRVALPQDVVASTAGLWKEAVDNSVDYTRRLRKSWRKRMKVHAFLR